MNTSGEYHSAECGRVIIRSEFKMSFRGVDAGPGVIMEACVKRSAQRRNIYDTCSLSDSRTLDVWGGVRKELE